MSIEGRADGRGSVPAGATAADAEAVRGERTTASVSRERSLQSRASSVLAGGLTMVLGVGALTWYYANALARSGKVRQNAAAATASRAQAEMSLPALGRIDAPQVAAAAPKPADDPPPAIAPMGSPVASADPLISSLPMSAASAAARSSYGTPPAPNPEQIAVRRKLAGAVFVGQSETAPVSGVAGITAGFDAQGTPATNESALAAALRPSATPAVTARVLPTRRFLLPKGAFIDCTLETAIDSSLPGMTTCVTATDTFSADGSVVLLERGTKLVGETRGQVQQGSARVFVLWTEARSPTGVVVPLDSPGTDELGRAGLSGAVDRHFWDRFGAAILVSTIDALAQSAAQSSAPANSTVVLNPTASQDVLTEVLKGTVNIPPTITKRNGDRIQVLVARDVDFRSVYELRSTQAQH